MLREGEGESEGEKEREGEGGKKGREGREREREGEGLGCNISWAQAEKPISEKNLFFNTLTNLFLFSQICLISSWLFVSFV